MSDVFVAIDAGTGSARALAFDLEGRLVTQAAREWSHAALPTASIVATGGLMTGGDAARVLAAGAAAAQLGTAFLRCPEAGTSDVHRRALLAETDTVLTREFTGRLARGIANAWTEGVGRQAPSAYPELHHVTAGLRAHGRAVADPDLVNLWAGTGHAGCRDLPAGDLVAVLVTELRAAH